MAKWSLLSIVALAAVGVASGQQYAPRATVNGETYKDVTIQIDLPKAQHVKNIPAPGDGKGLCVFATMSMAARWHNIKPLEDVIHKLNQGAGWPEKVNQVISQYAPNTPYIQYEGRDPGFLDRALSTDRPACVTYGYSERYGSTIYHMVLLVYLDDQYACILDNNFPGTYEWMPRQEFLKRAMHPQGQYWAFVFLVPPPPPVPHN